jgi:hypothetical protein
VFERRCKVNEVLRERENPRLVDRVVGRNRVEEYNGVVEGR